MINEAFSDTRKETVSAISSGLAKRLNCVFDLIYGIIKSSVSISLHFSCKDAHVLGIHPASYQESLVPFCPPHELLQVSY